MRQKVIVSTLTSLLLILTACRTHGPVITVPPTRFESPQPTSFESPLIPQVETPPLLEIETPRISEVEKSFSIVEPLLAGATTVSGTGPRGVAIIIVDATLMAQRLGAGIIQDDGTFLIQVDPPLIENHQIGIQVGIVDGQEVPPDYPQELAPYAGDSARDIPYIGTLWDVALVQSGH